MRPQDQLVPEPNVVELVVFQVQVSACAARSPTPSAINAARAAPSRRPPVRVNESCRRVFTSSTSDRRGQSERTSTDQALDGSDSPLERIATSHGRRLSASGTAVVARFGARFDLI